MPSPSIISVYPFGPSQLSAVRHPCVIARKVRSKLRTLFLLLLDHRPGSKFPRSPQIDMKAVHEASRSVIF